MKTRHRHSGVFALVLLVLLAGVGIFAICRVGKTIVTFSTARVERTTVTNYVSGTGTLQPLTTVEVKSNVGGTLVALNVDEGDTVKAGQVIAKIDPADSQNTVDQSQADLVSANSKVMQAQQTLAMQHLQNDASLRSATQAVEGVRVKLTQAKDQAGLQHAVTVTSIEQAQQNLIAAREKLAQAQEEAKVQPELTNMAISQANSVLSAAKSTYQQTKSAMVPQAVSTALASLNQARANFSYADGDLARQKKLLAKGFVSHSTVESAEQRYAVAKATLENAQDVYNTINEQTRGQIDAAQATVEQAELALRIAKANRIQDTTKQHNVVSAQAVVKQMEAALKSAQDNATQDKVKDGDVAAVQAEFKQAQAALDTARSNAYQATIKQGDITQAKAQVKRSVAAVTNAVTII